MVVGYVPGVWDLLHVGHLALLERAKGLCDKLIVGVAGDDITRKDKGEYPVIPETQRTRMVQSLSCVDIASAYYRLEFLTHLNLFNPDVLIVGDTWGHEERHNQAIDWVRENDRRLMGLPYTEGVSTTQIKSRVLKQHSNFDEE